MSDPESSAVVSQNNATNTPSTANGEQEQPKEVIAEKVTGTVKWFNVKSGYGFINRNDTKEDVFVHQTAIMKNNPKKAVRSVGDGELVEFDVVIGEKGNEASNVTGPEGDPVKGSPYAADKRRGNIFRRRGGFYRGGRMGTRGPMKAESTEGKEEAEEDEAAAPSGPKPRGAPRGSTKRYRMRMIRQGGGTQRPVAPGKADSIGSIGESKQDIVDEDMGVGAPRGRGYYEMRPRGRGRGMAFRGAYRSRGAAGGMMMSRGMSRGANRRFRPRGRGGRGRGMPHAGIAVDQQNGESRA